LYGQPRSCTCSAGWGPPASIDPALPYSQYQEYPCFFPSSVTLLSPLFVINGVLYNDSTTPGSVCGGFSNGAGVSVGNIGYCVCGKIPLLNPESLVPFQNAYDGAACTGPVPIIPPKSEGDRIVARFCNGARSPGPADPPGHGTVCPSGERQQNELVYGDPSGDPSLCSPGVDGCVCDNGWGGIGCTCPAPLNLAYGLLPVPILFGSYVDLLQLQPVRFVTVQATPLFVAVGCTPLAVLIGSSAYGADISCELAVNGTWTCPPAGGSYNGFSRFVVVETLEQTPSCIITVASSNDPPCGLNGNAYSGRFWANEFYRSNTTNLGPNQIAWSPFGCTNTACMCNPNTTGTDCTVAVSAYRIDPLGRLYPAVCGNDYLPPRGVVQAGSAGSYSSVGDTCRCEQVSSASNLDGVFVRPACECAAHVINGVLTECAGHGTCVAASFSYGRCADDLSDEAADPLNQPFAPVAAQPQQAGRPSYEPALIWRRRLRVPEPPQRHIGGPPVRPGREGPLVLHQPRPGTDHPDPHTLLLHVRHLLAAQPAADHLWVHGGPRAAAAGVDSGMMYPRTVGAQRQEGCLRQTSIVPIQRPIPV
jgi:hypothetical protein